MLEVVEVARRLTPTDVACRALLRAANAQWAAGFAEDAQNTVSLAQARSLEKGADVEVNTLRLIAVAQHKLGLRNAAKETLAGAVRSMAWFQGAYDAEIRTLRLLARTQTRCEMLDAARQILDRARHLAESHFEGKELGRVAVGYLGLGDPVTTDEIIHELLSARVYELGRHEFMLEIIEGEVTVGTAEHARATIRKAKKMMAAELDPWVHSGDLARIAGVEADHGWNADAEKTLEKAHRLAARVRDLQERIWTLLDLARVENRLGLVAARQRSFSDALKAAQGIADTGDRLDALLQVVAAQAELGLYPDADQTAEQLNDAKAKREAVSAIAAARITSALKKDDAADITETSARIDQVLRRGSKPQLQARLAAAQLRHGLGDLARRNFADALEQAAKLDNAEVWRDIAVAQADAGLYAEARTTATQLRPFGRLTVLLAIGRAQRTETASTRLGSADGTSETRDWFEHEDALW